MKTPKFWLLIFAMYWKETYLIKKLIKKSAYLVFIKRSNFFGDPIKTEVGSLQTKAIISL